MNILPNVIESISASQAFNALRTTNKVGDHFYVPTENLLVVLGTDVAARDAQGNEIKDEKGNVMTTQVGQYFPAIRVIDGKAADIQELYVGQIVKRDFNSRIVFPNILSSTLRQSGEAFKKTICGKELVITEEKEIDDRIWDNETQRWMRDPEDNSKLISRKNRALRFEPQSTTLNNAEMAKATKMLLDFYKSNEKYADKIRIEE